MISSIKLSIEELIFEKVSCGSSASGNLLLRNFFSKYQSQIKDDKKEGKYLFIAPPHLLDSHSHHVTSAQVFDMALSELEKEKATLKDTHAVEITKLQDAHAKEIANLTSKDKRDIHNKTSYF